MTDEELREAVAEAYRKFREADARTPVGLHEKFAALHEGAWAVKEFDK